MPFENNSNFESLNFIYLQQKWVADPQDFDFELMDVEGAIIHDDQSYQQVEVKNTVKLGRK